MKKVMLVLAVMLLTAPLYAGTITFGPVEYNAPGTCTIPYTTSDPAPVAMGLNVDCTAGVIDAVAVDSFFDIYMDAAYDLGAGYTYGAGNPIALQATAGGATLPLASFCISMGGLGGDAEPLDAAPTSGEIILSSADATGELSENTLRGGIIDVDGNAMTVVGLPIAFDIEGGVIEDCMQALGLDVSDPALYAKFLAVGSPECWCSNRQCKGDADSAFTGKDKDGGRIYVSQDDLDVLIAGWQKNDADAGLPDFICADFNHEFTGKDKDGGRIYVSQDDLDILIAGWQKNDTIVTPCF